MDLKTFCLNLEVYQCVWYCVNSHNAKTVLFCHP